MKPLAISWGPRLAARGRAGRPGVPGGRWAGVPGGGGPGCRGGGGPGCRGGARVHRRRTSGMVGSGEAFHCGEPDRAAVGGQADHLWGPVGRCFGERPAIMPTVRAVGVLERQVAGIGFEHAPRCAAVFGVGDRLGAIANVDRPAPFAWACPARRSALAASWRRTTPCRRRTRALGRRRARCR